MADRPPDADRWHSPDPDPDRARALSILRAHARGPSSFQVLERGFRYWFDPEAPAVVGYVEASRHRVAAGAPIGPPEVIAAVAARFVADAKTRGRGAVFFGVEAPFVEALRAAGVPHDALAIAEAPDWHPARYDLNAPTRRSLRAQVHRAHNKGVRVRRVDADELARRPGPVRAEIENVLDRWLASRRMSVMRFMVDLEPFTFPEERRYYLAECGDRAVGFLAAVPVYQRRGWFFEDVIRVPDAPNGTAELMIHTALEDARAAGDDFVTLGMAPLAGVAAGPGPHRLIRSALRLCYARLGALYHFAGVRRFKARFRPDVWTPQYLVATPGPVGIWSFHAVLAAFAGGGLVSFGLDTLRRLFEQVPNRLWAQLVNALAALLVPWTVLLALADGTRWFGGPSIQAAWVAFDALMVLALGMLAEQARRGGGLTGRLAMILSGCTLADFVLSSVQAFHLHRAASGFGALFVAAGICGPLLATALLAALAWARAR